MLAVTEVSNRWYSSALLTFCKCEFHPRIDFSHKQFEFSASETTQGRGTLLEERRSTTALAVSALMNTRRRLQFAEAAIHYSVPGPSQLSSFLDHQAWLTPGFKMSFGSPIVMAFANATRRQAEAAMNEPSEIDPAVPIADMNHEPVRPTAPTFAAPAPAKRRLQCVSTKSAKVRVLTWMKDQAVETGTEKNLISTTVRQFPEVFRAESYGANLMKCSRWWAEKDSLFADFEWDQRSLSHSIVGWRKRVELKARPGRGRKTSEWNSWLYPLVRSEFERLRRSGVKFSADVLLMMAKNVLLHSPHPTFGPSTVLPSSGKTLMDTITPRWIQQFQEVQGIVCRHQTGKLQVSPEKTEVIERATAYHMGQLARGFASGELLEDLLENMDETHFVVNMDNGKTLGFRGDTEVKYADVVSGGLGITMVVKVTGGRAARIATPMLIFQNTNSSYPIRGTPDNVPGVCYRSSPSSFINSALLTEYYSEPRVSWADVSGRTKIQFIDNCPGHNEIGSCTTALARIRTQLRYFPSNSTHLTQPCDSFVISKIKDAWRRRWDQKKMDMIGAHMWQGDGRDGTSGALQNPGWRYFLQIAADSVKDVNAQTDAHYGITYARKAMIQCGLSLNLDGTWDVKQLTPQLQEVIVKYRGNFEGSLEGLEPATIPRQTPSSNTGVGRGRGRARASTIDGASAALNRGQSRGRTVGTPGTDSINEAQVAPSPPIDAGRGSTIASNWAATRPGARLHRKAARRGATFVASSSHTSVHTQHSAPGGGGNSIDEQPQSSVFQDAQGPESVDIDAAAELSLDSAVLGYLETQYDV